MATVKKVAVRIVFPKCGYGTSIARSGDLRLPSCPECGTGMHFTTLMDALAPPGTRLALRTADSVVELGIMDGLLLVIGFVLETMSVRMMPFLREAFQPQPIHGSQVSCGEYDWIELGMTCGEAWDLGSDRRTLRFRFPCLPHFNGTTGHCLVSTGKRALYGSPSARAASLRSSQERPFPAHS